MRFIEIASCIIVVILILFLLEDEDTFRADSSKKLDDFNLTEGDEYNSDDENE